MDRRDRQALIDIRDVLDRAMGYPIEGVEAFHEKHYLQDAVIRCLEILGEASKRLSPDLRRLHPQVPWRARAGMRDILSCLRPGRSGGGLDGLSAFSGDPQRR
jgi:uncharacterized protein with HEPN domain